jgi:CRP-like cAMP-binding protein/CheY-like chemotaxis protein
MGKAKILIVEDEAIVAADIEDCLHNLGYDVCGCAASGERAIVLAEQKQPDLVLMDIMLQGLMDGIRAAAHLKEVLNLPVVYLTSHADEFTLERAKVTEPFGYVLKPFEEVNLRIALELALHKHRMQREDKLKSGLGQTQSSAGSERSQSAPIMFKSSPDFNKKIEFLRRMHPFSKVENDGLALFCSGCRLRSYSVGEFIALEDDPDVEGFLVLSGRVAMLKTSSSGRQLIVELLPPGDIFGLIVAIDHESYPLTARSQVASEIMWVPRGLLLQFLERYPEWYQAFVNVISERLSRSYGFSRALAHDRVEVRIASTLLALVPRFGTSPSSGGLQHSRIAITRQELADLTGTSVETAIRVTKSMERQGLLDLKEAGVVKILDIESLQYCLDT